MANAFTASYSYRTGGPVGKTILSTTGTLVIDTTATGGAVDGDLPASMFGLSTILECSQIILSDNTKVYFAGPSADMDSLIVGGGASNAPMDLPNGTYTLTIKGY